MATTMIRGFHLVTRGRPLSMATSNNSQSAGPVETAIREKLNKSLRPSELVINNDSWQHRHHAAMRAEGGGNGETHFSLQVVSDAFKGKSTMQRHRMIYSALSEELSQGLHALSLKTKTSEEIQSTGGSSEATTIDHSH